MSDPWIRLHANLAHKPVVWRLADHLGISKHEAMGLLAEFWGNVSQHAKNGQVTQLPDAQIEAWADWRGERGRFASFVRTAHVDTEGRVNEWDEYHGKLETRREYDRKRKEVLRKSAGSPADVHGTSTPTIRNETKQATKTTTSASQAAKASWVGPLVEIWSSRVAPVKHGRLGKALLDLHSLYGPEKLEAGLLAYIDATAGKTRKLEWFADDAVRWIAPTPMPPLVDEHGDLTEYGERMSRPPGYRPQ